MSAPDDALAVRFFDGRHSRPHGALLRVNAGMLTVVPDDSAAVAPSAVDAAFAPLSVPLTAVRWPERTRHGGRLAQLPDGASLQAQDVAAWDDWVGRHHRHESWVVRAQQNWRSVAVALVLLLGAIAAMYQWGLPWVATGVTAVVPRSVDALVGRQVLASLDDSLLKPTTLSPDAQQRIRDGFTRMIQRAHPDGAPEVRLEFRSARDPRFGPNALALPGGTIVLTDALVELMPGENDAVLGVLGHEFGHVLRRHAMRQLVQASAVGFAMSIAFGDYGTLIGSAPVLLATLGYSRDLEREADAESVRLMRASGISPRAMATFFEALDRWRTDQSGNKGEQNDKDDKGGASGDDPIGLAFSSHPATAERIEFFKNAAQE